MRGGGEEREKEIVMDGYMLMNKKKNKKNKNKIQMLQNTYNLLMIMF